ncbi:isocitrate lyase/PEP mutase family protein [Hyphobacterium sp.]|uniref:isocitrate lyase/PEP mutase family protein n=1 Tax=Hyphobacterium sp. TaxID=2004662 RepID=UPI003BAB15BB
MQTQAGKAQTFHSLHQAGNPLVLYNIWDAGSAKAVAEAGAKAIATGSWSVAAAQGYDDGEKLPLDRLLRTAKQISSAVELPVNIDFEGGYAAEPEFLADNIAKLIATGAVGINFEDRIVSGDGLYSIEDQAKRIAAIRGVADETGIPLFINARTDVFLKTDAADHANHMKEATDRADVYAEAGASGIFIPGLSDADLIGRFCEHTNLPVNAYMKEGAPSIAEMAKRGVSRISHGPAPYREAMRALADRAAGVYQS